MSNYPKKIPKDQEGAPMTKYPSPFKAQARYYRDNGATSSVITLTDNTTQIEVGNSGTGGVIVRWVPVTETAGVSPFASVLTTNYDHYVPANAVREFVVPKEVQGTSSIVGLNIQNGLYRRVAVIATSGPTSVLTTEY